MRNPKRYNQFSHYLKEKFGAKVYKITIDAGFPVRTGMEQFQTADVYSVMTAVVSLKHILTD